MSGLTSQECGRMVKGFLMASGGIALAMVLFALTGQLDLMAVVLTVVGVILVGLVSPVLGMLHRPALVVYAIMVIGLAVVAGAIGGYFIINMVTSALR